MAVKSAEFDKEVELLRKIMKEERGTYPSVVLAGDNLGADILMLGSRKKTPASEGRETRSSNLRKQWLLIKVQAKARQKKSDVNEARLSLELPFGIKRKEQAKPENQMSAQEKSTKKESERKAQEFAELENDCVVVHVICRTDGEKRVETAISKRKKFVEIMINRYVWENDSFLNSMKRGSENIVEYNKRTKSEIETTNSV